jgi:IclR family acetate operon transcriptional repressor
MRSAPSNAKGKARPKASPGSHATTDRKKRSGQSLTAGLRVATNVAPTASSLTNIGNPSLRLLTLIESIAQSEKPQTLAQLVVRLDEPKATVHRLLLGLEEMRFVQRMPGGRHFAPGPRLNTLAIDTLRHSHISGQRHSILKQLVSEFNESCNLTILDGIEVVYLDRAEANWPLRMDLKPGSRVPAHCSASGKMMLALMAPSVRDPLIKAMPYQAYTAQTITDPRTFQVELDRIVRRGYSVDQEEYAAGLNCLSVPVLDDNGQCIAAVAVHAPVARLSIKEAVKKIDRLQWAAAAITATLQNQDINP